VASACTFQETFWRIRHEGYISYLRQGDNAFAGFCLFVCLFVCQQHSSKSYGRIFLKFWGYVRNGNNYQLFNFGGDSAGILDSGSLWNFRYHCVEGGIREPLAKWIWWRHLANNIALAEVPAGYDCFLVRLSHRSVWSYNCDFAAHETEHSGRMVA